MMGRILCVSFVDINEKLPGTVRIDEPPYRNPKDSVDDSRVVKAAKEILEEAHLIVGWNSKLHDIPLLNARLMKHGLAPVQIHLHLDLMWYAAGSSMKIGSRKLDNVAKFFGCKQQKTQLDWDTWARAGAGDKAAMQYVAKHCEQDVEVLREVYWRLLPNVKNIHR